MGTYYYIPDKNAEDGRHAIYEDDYLRAIYSIAKKHGLKIEEKLLSM